METTERVLICLKEKNEPMRSAQIAEATGLDKKAVDAALILLKAEQRITSPKRCYYVPSEI